MSLFPLRSARVSVHDLLEDEFRSLHNDSACGIWVGERPNNTMVVGAAYTGCYVRQKDEEYVMTLLLKETVDGAPQQYKMEKTCLSLSAMDAPSPDVCSAVGQADKVACAGPSVPQDACEGMGCCYSARDASMPCFFGNKLTTQCTIENNMVIAMSKDLTRPSTNLDSVHVIGVDSSSCAGFSLSKSDSFAVFKFPFSCGGHFQTLGDPVTYENTIEATRGIETWQGSSITRDSTLQVTVRCRYIQTGVVPLQLSVSTLPPPLPVTTTGPLLLEMRIAQDAGYTSYYSTGDYPVVKVLRDPIYLEVHILHRTDPNLVLVLNDCWATSSAEPTLIPQWPILMDRCPFYMDSYLSRLVSVGAPSQAVPIPNHYKRFLVNTFTFVDANSQLSLADLVYFHCSASVCVPSNLDDCKASCGQRKKRMAEPHEVQTLKMAIVSSEGPVALLYEGEVLKLEGSHQPWSSSLDLARALATAGTVASVAVTIVGIWLHRKRHSCNIKAAVV
ncbi:zona pellucida sperm-binding protein 4-like isoform X2 [Hyperolius riggenbachi]|uniref:zona pellucida sperm-binding protein 4-like isoform X2 n=1 Tax=Hyperolius riggenbachi TaxID=752182 RepID=UPI0035A29573